MNINDKSTNFIVRNIVTDSFIRDIAKIPVMTKEEEQQLFMDYESSQNRLKAAEGTSDYMTVKEAETQIQDAIRNEIITRNQRFNLAVAKRYNGGDLIMELVNVGAIGMYEAFQRYNYKTDNRFCSFAVWYIRRAINAFLVRENITVRTTNNTTILSKVKKIEDKFFAQEGRFPSDNEIKDILKSEYNIVDADVTEFHKVTTPSIDSLEGDDEDGFNATNYEFANKTAAYNDYETTSHNEDLGFKLKSVLGTLSERERIIICMSSGYGYDKEYKDYEIGEELNMTSERVRQIRHQTHKKLAKMLVAQNIA
jgi:RNA polymerase sigma factor (sigma-70 family)